MTTLCATFQATAAKHPDLVALRTPADAVTVTWREYAERVQRIAAGLAALGVRRGDTVALMMVNRPEFHLVDTAVFHLGATPFSLYNTSSPEQIRFLVGNAGNRVVVCEEQFLPSVLAGREGSAIEHVVCVDAAPEGTIGLAELETREPEGFDFEATWRAVEPDDVLTLIYTSGTTGPPKGVELSHRNMLAAVTAAESVLPADHNDRIISFLPHAHVADRWGTHYTQIVTGLQVTCVANRRAVLAAVVETRPTIFGAVPQVWYNIRAGVEAMIAGEVDQARKAALTKAVRIGLEHVRAEEPDEQLRARYRAADERTLAPLRTMIGFDRIRYALCGAAPITADAVEFINALGIPLSEGWGMSEVCGLATLNPPRANRFGTCGPAIPGVELRLGPDNELLVRGELVMKGYRGTVSHTAAELDDEGWLHTGDVATMDPDGYVRIIDRKKELIINSSGKNMSPSTIENTIRAGCPLIGQLVAIGDARPYNVALVLLEPEVAKGFATANGLAGADLAELSRADAVRAAVADGIDTGNQRLARVEQIKRFAILPTWWEPGCPELTHTLKLRRGPISERYAAEIEQLYAD
ncbi:AMP-dependent synthetase/ligase [Kutzneria sp. NPDC052558]|uniref:AMP-dependent synthetase/ligase n=1 Tax=Kutzneria sp. NPDC052558 TaxID=3364121 RepID=UPI0037CA0BF2